MSKRSFRRLAAALGATLALGTMAPALAASIGLGGEADGSVEVVTPNLLPGNLNVFQTLGYAKGEVYGVHNLAMNDVSNLNSMVKGDLIGVVTAVNVGGLFNSQGNSCSSLVIVAGCNNGPGGNINVLSGDGPLALASVATQISAPITAAISQVGLGSFGVGNITNNLGLTSNLLANL